MHRFKLAVSEAVTAFNDGAKSHEDLLSKLDLDCGVSAKKVSSVQNKIGLRNAKIKSTEKCSKRRQALRQMRKDKKTDESYIAEGFSKSVIPDIIPVNTVPDTIPVDNIIDMDISSPIDIDVTFVHDKDGQSVITLHE